MASILNATTSSGLVTSADNSGSLQLATNNGTTALTIDTSQNVGIGTTSLNGVGKLVVKLSGAGSTNGLAVVSSANDSLLTIFNTGSVHNIESTYSSTGSYQPIAFVTSGSERMRINSAGQVVVNKTVSDMGCQMEVKGANAIGSEVTTVTGTGLQVTYTPASGLVYWCNWTYNGSNMGSITSSGSTTAYNTGSDYRLKENIAPITGALAKVAQLKPSTWTWKRNGSDGQGFIAHELAEVCPDAVVGEKDAVNSEGNPIYQGVDTSFLVATLTAAIQELKAELDATKAEVQALKGTL